MYAETLPIERMDGGIVALRMFTDDAPHIDADFIARLARAVAALQDVATLRVIVVEGGERYF